MKRIILMTSLLVAQLARAQDSKAPNINTKSGVQSSIQKRYGIQMSESKLMAEKILIGNTGKIQLNLVRRGNEGGGGGASAADPVTGQRRLLDLLEKDQLNYFVPSHDQLQVNKRGYKVHPLANYLNELIAYFYNNNVRVNSKSHLLSMVNEEKIAEMPFLYVLMKVIDNENLSKLDNDGIFENAYGQRAQNICNFELPQLLKWAFVDFDLVELKDEGQISFENELTKKQVAVQKDGIVIINKNEFEALDKDSQTALFLHESILRTVLILNPQNIAIRGTQDVRTMTRRLFNYFKEDSYPAYPVLEAFQNLNISSNFQCKQYVVEK